MPASPKYARVLLKKISDDMSVLKSKLEPAAPKPAPEVKKIAKNPGVFKSTGEGKTPKKRPAARKGNTNTQLKRVS